MLDNEKKALRRLRNRVWVGSRGITLPKDSGAVMHLQSKQGGAGPQGTATYIGDTPGDHSNQMSLVIYPEGHYMTKYALPTTWVEVESETNGEKRKVLQAGEHIFLEKVKSNWKGALPDGRKVNTLSKSRFHPYRTFSFCLYRACRHMQNNEGCKYCTANLLVNKLNFHERLSNQENLDYLQLAMANNPIRSVTITSGTIESPEWTARELISLARLIKEKTGMTIHVQTEPIFDQSLLRELSEVTDSIGILMEFFDERVRKEICPGKSRLFSQDDYMRSWEKAVSCYGWGKIWNTNLIGFDEDFDIILKGIERAAKIGVMTSILCLRVGSPELGEYLPTYLSRSEDELLQLHMEAAKILVKYAVDSIAGENSGCLGCHGCSACNEAIMWARTASRNDEGNGVL